MVDLQHRLFNDYQPEAWGPLDGHCTNTSCQMQLEKKALIFSLTKQKEFELAAFSHDQNQATVILTFNESISHEWQVCIYLN